MGKILNVIRREPMAFISRLYLSIKGRWVKSLLLVLLIVFLLTFALGSYTVQSATYKLEGSIKLRLGSRASIRSQLDLDEVYASGYERDLKTIGIYTSLINIFDEVATLPEVLDVDYRLINANSWALEVELLSSVHSCEGYFMENRCNSVQVTGVSSENTLEYDNRNYLLDSGRMLTKEEIDAGAPLAVLDNSTVHFKPDGKAIEVCDIIKISTPVGSYIVGDNYVFNQEDVHEFEVEVVGLLRSADLFANQPMFISSKLNMEAIFEIDAKEKSLSKIGESNMS